MSGIKETTSTDRRILVLWLWTGIICWLFALNAPATAAGKTTANLTESYIRALSPAIRNVSLIAQYDAKGKSMTSKILIDVELNKDVFTGGAQDWNSIATDIHHISSDLLAHQETVRINYSFWSTDAKPVDWARAWVTRANLPGTWADLTYLEFFSHAIAVPGNLQSTKWLCEFYRKYSSARPAGSIPPFCDARD